MNRDANILLRVYKYMVGTEQLGVDIKSERVKS
jgi:hypothetical protein